MMNAKPTNSFERRLNPQRCYNATVRSFVQHYCGRFSWQLRVLGLLRAKNYTGLLSLAEGIEQDLIRSNVRASGPDTEYRDATSFKLAMQFTALVCKYQFSKKEIPDLDPVAAALKDFLGAERRNRRLNNLFAAHIKRGTERHWSIPLIRDVFCRVLGRTPHYEDILDKADFSSGAAVNIKGDATHLSVKLGGDVLEGNPAAFPYFAHAITRNKHYSDILSEPTRVGFNWLPIGSAGDRKVTADALMAKCVEVMYDEIKVVAKKARSGRTIGKNPRINNFVQKGLDLVMRHLLRRSLGIDLSDQVTNCQMSYYGSLPDQYDPYVTIDVKGASNSVLTQVVRSVTPPRWFKLMNNLRSTHALLPDGTLHQYQMFVSMGNGFCFPLESLLFAAICIAAYKHTGSQPDYRVYGDDIIVRQSHALVVIEILKACGFAVNVHKTYVFGPFRESCGANWYDGEGVTPGYLKEPIKDARDLHVIHNALAAYPLVQQDIRALVQTDLCCVPDLPAWSFITDQAFKVPYDVALASPGTTYFSDTQSFVYRITVTVPKPDKNWVERNALSRRKRGEFLVAAVLRGSDSETPFHLKRAVSVRISYTDPVFAALQQERQKKRSEVPLRTKRSVH